MSGHLARLVAAGTLGLGVAFGSLQTAAAVFAQQPPPVFRSAVDLIAVDVQVVDGRGNPVPSLGPDRFDVLIDGRRRRVVSADFIRMAATPPATGTAQPMPAVTVSASPAGSRTVILAVDTLSFDVGAVRVATATASQFIDALGPEDQVGLYAYPDGPRIDPTTDRAGLRIQLGRVLGKREPWDSRYNLKPSEIVDITAEPMLALPAGGGGGRGGGAQSGFAMTAVSAVQERECPNDADCPSRILSEANHLALQIEGETARSLSTLQSLIARMTNMPGRKAVVILSGGVLSSDRPGGKPDVGHFARFLGQTAAAANVRVYTIQMEAGVEGVYSSASRGGDKETGRDRDLRGVWLDEFSGLAGGTMIKVVEGGGESAFDRILRETSAYYLLGVEAADGDRDGRARPLRVTVKQRGLTVRSREWVMIPPRAN